MFGQQLRLKREDAQHVVYALSNFLDPIGTPSPNRRTHEVNRGDALLLQVAFKVKVEIWGIDADEGTGWIGQQSLAQLVSDPYYFAVVP